MTNILRITMMSCLDLIYLPASRLPISNHSYKLLSGCICICSFIFSCGKIEIALNWYSQLRNEWEREGRGFKTSQFPREGSRTLLRFSP